MSRDRGVVGHHEQRAARRSPLEPVVRAAVELDEFADAGAALAPLVDDGLAGAARLPQPLGDQQPNLAVLSRLKERRSYSLIRSLICSLIR